MANVPITSLPVAISIGSTTDYLEISKYTGTPGALYQSYRVNPQVLAQGLFFNNAPSGLEYIIYNSGSTLTAGVQPYITMPYSATITGATLVVAPTGSITVDIWRCAYAQFDGGSTHPVAGDSICASNKLSVSGGLKATSTLVGWTISLNQGDVLAFNTSGISNVTQATITLYLQRSFP